MVNPEFYNQTNCSKSNKSFARLIDPQQPGCIIIYTIYLSAAAAVVVACSCYYFDFAAACFAFAGFVQGAVAFELAFVADFFDWG